jgi:hypothetical protein
MAFYQFFTFTLSMFEAIIGWNESDRILIVSILDGKKVVKFAKMFVYNSKAFNILLSIFEPQRE